MSQTTIAQQQRTLAQTAVDDPAYRFPNRYRLMHWRPWIETAARAVLARPGSHTAGVDHVTRQTFERDFETQSTALVEALKRKTYQPAPVRRVFIPKANGSPRPLGIATLKDRVVQEAMRMALDPIFESDFRHHSYGFRKGRRTMDAVAMITTLVNTRRKHCYVIEGDIQSYFDRVQHRKLLALVRRRVADRARITLLWKFLKAGVLHHHHVARTEEGVPQGSGISPVLANVYLHELDRWAEATWDIPIPEQARHRRQGRGHYRMVRYADDWVVVSRDTIRGVREAKQQIAAYLAQELHLTLSPEKTVMTHVSEGFTFLGFHIQRVWRDGTWVTHLRPSATAKRRVRGTIKDLTSRSDLWVTEAAMLAALNRVVRGWCEYYRHTSLLTDLNAVCAYTWHRYLRWLRKKHPGVSTAELCRTRYQRVKTRMRWTATTRPGSTYPLVWQWHPAPGELRRSYYRLKGRHGLPHPYLTDEPEATQDYTAWTEDGNESTTEPHVGPRCQRGGAEEQLCLYHLRGIDRQTVQVPITLCDSCHQSERAFGQLRFASAITPGESRVR